VAGNTIFDTTDTGQDISFSKVAVYRLDGWGLILARG